MKNKIDYRIFIIIALLALFIVLCFFYFGGSSYDYSDYYNTKNTTVTNETISFTTTSQVSAALTEDIPLRTGYYFKEMLVEDNVVIKKGNKIIKYTNGNYMIAPYDLIITEVNLPDSKKICNSTHYITVSTFNVLSSEFRVDETKIDAIYVGKTVKIKIPALNDREYEGIVTDITNIANNGKFTATVEFDNDGDVKLGMTINITV